MAFDTIVERLEYNDPADALLVTGRCRCPIEVCNLCIEMVSQRKIQWKDVYKTLERGSRSVTATTGGSLYARDIGPSHHPRGKILVVITDRELQPKETATVITAYFRKS
jgi:hypothetical protein